MKPTALIDANLLVLLIIGHTDKGAIAKHRRSVSFTALDFDLLVEVLSRFSRVVVTPHVLAEASNLLSQCQPPLRTNILEIFRAITAQMTEHHVSVTIGSADSAFLRLGLTDSTLLYRVECGDCLVTTDLPLFLEAERRGHNAINFNRLRAFP